MGFFCAHIGKTGPRESPDDGGMNEMALPSGHRIHSYFESCWSEAEHAPHSTEVMGESGEETGEELAISEFLGRDL